MPKTYLAIVDADVRIQRYLRKLLADSNYDVQTFECGGRILEHLKASPHPAVLFVSNRLPDIDHLDLIQQIRNHNPHLKIVTMPGVNQSDCVADAIRAGASCVLAKPFHPVDLLELVHRYAKEKEASPKSDEVELPIGNHMRLVYSSAAMREVHKQATMVARVNLPVLILGESGTGKEVIARYVHSASKQADNIFLKVNCAAVPSELLESELFGYEQGAFTGAGRSKPGKFKLCDQGTMFLDEIGEMHPNLQAKLLQVLQDGTFSPLGSRITQKVNVRIIAATNVDISDAIAKKIFREDLYYRLNGFCFKLSPLRERREDIPVLLRYFLRRYTQELNLLDVNPLLSTRLVDACERYDWPGNLRELESFVKRYLVLGDEQLMLDELAREMVDLRQESEITSTAIMQAMHSVGGNRRSAAKALGISYKALVRKLRDFQIDSKPKPMWIT